MQHYIFKAPYSKYNTNKKIERLPDRELQEMIDSEINVFELIYKPYNLTQEDMNEDVRDSIAISIFRDSTNSYIQLPAKYVTVDTNEQNKIKYTGRAIAIDIGALPSEESINFLLADIKMLIEARTGVTPIVELLTTTDNLFDEDVHDAYEADRAVKRTDNSNFYLNLQECKREKQILLTYLEEIDECAIHEHCDCDN